MEDSGKVNEITVFHSGTGGSPDAVHVAEKELGDGANVCLEQGLFNVTNKRQELGAIGMLMATPLN